MITMDEKQPRLTRKERGLVRRATNRLTALERRQFPSSSDPSKHYVTAIMPGGLVTCDCRGWVTKKPYIPRQCKHAFELIARRTLMTDTEHLFVLQYMTDCTGPMREYNPLLESAVYRRLLTATNPTRR